MHTAAEYNIINNGIVPKVIERFMSKQTDYTHDDGATFLALGARGQFADLNRKFWKLKAAVWDERELTDESTIEVCEDMVGHLLLMLYCLGAHREYEVSAGGRPPNPSRSEVGPIRESHLALPGRCDACDDCRADDPIWCYAWGHPNAYVFSHMSQQQEQRTRRMWT